MLWNKFKNGNKKEEIVLVVYKIYIQPEHYQTSLKIPLALCVVIFFFLSILM